MYIPGIKSRFDSEKIIEDLMKIERLPKDRAENNISRIETERGYWQEVGTRTKTLADSARLLFSYQNPFNDRTVSSSDESIITAIASRDSIEQDTSFTVKQIAQADRFLSSPLEENYNVEGGVYTFSVGNDEISFDFKGGTLRDFADALNRRGRDKVQASLIAVKSGTRSLLIESKVTGEENRLGFAGDALTLGVMTGMLERTDDGSGEPAFRPLNAVSTAKDAIISMEGIEIQRSTNEIDDIVPGLTITVKGTSDRPVRLRTETDTESIKDAIITMVGNYNRLMAEINVLTRNDEKIVEELNYLTKDEKDDYKKRLGSFSGDSTLTQIRSSLVRIVNTPLQNSDNSDISLLAQIGIGTDIRRAGGADASRLRGYLEIDEKALDAAISSNLPAVKNLFGFDSTGDLIADTGVAYSIDALAKPYTDSTGIFTQKTNNINTRIDQERRRIETLDRQLAAKELVLKRQYGQMESAYNRMEQMSSSFDRFQQQNSNY